MVDLYVARSSGLTSDGASVNSTTSRQVACPPGETNITDVVLNSVGSVLYSAAGNTVRIWDLRMYDSCFHSIFISLILNTERQRMMSLSVTLGRDFVRCLKGATKMSVCIHVCLSASYIDIYMCTYREVIGGASAC